MNFLSEIKQKIQSPSKKFWAAFIIIFIVALFLFGALGRLSLMQKTEKEVQQRVAQNLEVTDISYGQALTQRYKVQSDLCPLRVIDPNPSCTELVTVDGIQGVVANPTKYKVNLIEARVRFKDPNTGTLFQTSSPIDLPGVYIRKDEALRDMLVIGSLLGVPPQGSAEFFVPSSTSRFVDGSGQRLAVTVESFNNEGKTKTGLLRDFIKNQAPIEGIEIQNFNIDFFEPFIPLNRVFGIQEN